MSELPKFYVIRMPDNSEWSVPVAVIALHRAKEYAHEFGGDVDRSLAEDTVPLFADNFEIRDWAQNNMNWDDVKEHAALVTPPRQLDMQNGWINGEYRFT